MNLTNRLKAIFLGTLCGVALSVVFLLIFTFLFIKMERLPHNLVPGFAGFCSALGAFFSGYTTLRILKHRGILYGIISGVVFFCVMFFASQLVCFQSPDKIIFSRFLIIALSATIGGVMGVNKKSRI